MTPVFFCLLADLRSTLLEDTRICVRRTAVAEDVTKLYSGDEMPDIVTHNIHVTFKDEMGQDAGGVTRDCLATYWRQTLEEWFHGENAKVPCVPASRFGEAETTFLAAGRILVHGLILTRAMPIQLS